jgi:hypothetical protein
MVKDSSHKLNGWWTSGGMQGKQEYLIEFRLLDALYLPSFMAPARKIYDMKLWEDFSGRDSSLVLQFAEVRDGWH